MTTETKVCTRCGEEKPRAAFYSKSRLNPTLQSWCKACQNAYATARAQERRAVRP